jgi:ribosomal protein S27E
MAIIETVRCPNCGALAERHHLHMLAQVKTQCDECDYLIVTSTRTGSVIEAYAPGIYASQIMKRQTIEVAPPVTKPEVARKVATTPQPQMPQRPGIELTPVNSGNMQIFLSQSVGERRELFTTHH